MRPAPPTCSQRTSSRRDTICRRCWWKRRGCSTPRSRRTIGRSWGRWPSTGRLEQPRKDAVDDALGEVAVQRRSAEKEAVVDRAEEQLVGQADVDVGAQLAALDAAPQQALDLLNAQCHYAFPKGA